MCVVTYLPDTGSGFVLTSNRDESIRRPAAVPPRRYLIGEQLITFPKDPQAGGTWIATTERLTLCLLNGAFQKHVHRPPYRRSRGLVLLDAFSYDSPHAFAARYDFSGVEPFTLVMVESKEPVNTLHEVCWNGTEAHLKCLPPDSPRIWSSVTLYSEAVVREREGWFQAWLTTPHTDEAAQIIDFHISAGKGDPTNDLRVNRGSLKTVSLTQIQGKQSEISIFYQDFLHEGEYLLQLS
ncbi:NRDE family protein [Persicitalea sp.]|uniref:NRDE family protein n=1 Tax=Persicitalea sp. TaxID=3100273 RepID=UPI003593A8DA